MLTTEAVDDHQVSDNTFGLFIAYVLPGFTAAYGLPIATTNGAGWPAIFSTPIPTVSDLVLLLAQAVAVGLIVSTVRWLTVDTLHHRTGLRPPTWDFTALEHDVAVIELLIQIHYRYYKWYSNMVVALLWSFLARGREHGWQTWLVYALLIGLFFAASRDALRKYYERTAAVFLRP